MHSLQRPAVPSLAELGHGEGERPSVHDVRRDGRAVVPAGPTASMYTCGITPYDATHLGHAATYVGYDLLHRAWRNAGHDVTYVQNVTDVDDPLLERAEADEPAPVASSMELVAFAATPELRARLEATVPIEGRTSYSLYFRDPDGRRVGISSYPDVLA